jgi:hypothetical protein
VAGLITRAAVRAVAYNKRHQHIMKGHAVVLEKSNNILSLSFCFIRYRLDKNLAYVKDNIL